jgi:hypothetical protein
LSVICGITLVYVHFRVFDPITLLFEVGNGTSRALARMAKDLHDKCGALEKNKRILISMVENLDDDSRVRIMEEFHLRREEIDRHLDDVRNYAEGWHRDSEGNLMSLFVKERYHAERLELWHEGDFMSYDQWVRIISDVELYMKGLDRFEVGLQERRRDYLEVIRARGVAAPGLTWTKFFNALIGAATAYVGRSHARG